MSICDWIAKQISDAMVASFNRNDGYVDGLTSIMIGTNRPSNGLIHPPKKSMKVKVKNKWYTITVEEDNG